MATIRDVAILARVSIKTVSRVINESPLVSPETNARVAEAIRRLDFHPHSFARNLARRRAHAIAVCIPLTVEHVFAHTFFFQILHGIAEVLQHRDYELLLHARPDVHSFLPLWKERRVDGLILMSVPVRDPRVFELGQARVPFVLTCRPDEPDSDLDQVVAWVDADHAQGAEAAATHLLSLGHRRIAFINGPGNLMVSRFREAGFRQALARHGLDSANMPIFSGDFNVESGRTLGAQLLELPDRPTGVFCADDTLAIGVIQAAAKRGLSVPADLSVVGFDDMTLSRYLEPPLTTVRQPAEEKGRLAATEVLHMLDFSADSRAKHHLLRTELVIRRSTAPRVQKTDTDRVSSIVARAPDAAAPDQHAGASADPCRRL